MSENQTPVVFTGNAGEYFGIWIVNLLLSIVTLGIYSAWAKVRRKKYFYNNTLVDGVGFDYHANPISILKGRIIAFVLLVAYSILTKSSPLLAGILIFTFMLALPWIVVRGMTFNARNSSHRGLRFDFDGKYGQAALVFIGYTLLIFVTLGLALPFVAQRSRKFVFDHHKFGLSHFQMNALVKDFYIIYLKILAIPLAIALIGILAAVALPSYSKYKTSHVSLNQPQHIKQASVIESADTSVGGFIKVANVTTTDNAITDQTNAETTANEKTLSDEDYLKNLTQAERADYDALVKKYDDQAKQAENIPKQNLIEKMFGSFAGKLGPMMYALFFGIALLYGTVIFSISAYLQSRIQNLVWNNTTLEQVKFFSNQRMRDLVMLYLTNTIVLIFTIGLATPWAQIRMARYRIERLALSGETDWDKFVGEKKIATRAIGEEVADMFDVDISFG